MMSRLIPCALMFGLMAASRPADAQPCPPPGECTIFVKEDAVGSSGCSFDDNEALGFLQDALAMAMNQSNAVICIAEGTYLPDCTAITCTGDPNATFELIDGVEIHGGFVGDPLVVTEDGPEDRQGPEDRPEQYGFRTYLDGQLTTPTGGIAFSKHVVTVPGGGAYHLDRVAVRHGIAAPDDKGGGILQNGGTLDVVESIIEFNVADEGAGIWIDAGAETHLDRCLIQGNISKFCAGVLASEFSNIHSENTEYFANSSGGAGGGACLFKAEGYFHGDIFRDNTAGPGSSEHPAYVGGGGAVFVRLPIFVDLYNCTIVENVAQTTDCNHGGGGVEVAAEFVANHVRIRNSIVWGNTDLSCPLSDCECDPDIHDFEDQIKLPGTGVILEYSDVQYLADTPIGPGITDNNSDGVDDNNGNMDTEPIFAGAGRIAIESPLVNRGNNTYTTWPNDIFRDSRIVGEVVDMGANEIQVGACCLMGQCSFGPVGECGFVCDMYDYFAAPPYTGCRGDVDGNGFVNPGDRGFVAANIGQTAPDKICKFDLDGNGVINPGDRGVVSANIGQCNPLPDFQNGSGSNQGVSPDPRFINMAEFFAGEFCEEVSCEEGGGQSMMGGGGGESSASAAPGAGEEGMGWPGGAESPAMAEEPTEPTLHLAAGGGGSYSIMIEAAGNCINGALIFGVSDADDTVIDEVSGALTVDDLGDTTSGAISSPLFGGSFARRDMIVIEPARDPEETGGELCTVTPAASATLRLEVYVWRVNEDDTIDTWSAALTAE